ERGGLENRCAGNSTQGSNPCLSATLSTLNMMQDSDIWSGSCDRNFAFSPVFFALRPILVAQGTKICGTYGMPS
ncbi:MAG TPA: hypothetical protein DD437_08700, partial [Rhodobiaceae bacterium]|nr:hypothetical protein [Rhodobiaceae bacterium]